MSDLTTPEDPTIKPSRDLAEILDLAARLLLGEAVNAASAQVDGHSLPGGDAMATLAQAVDLETWERRNAHAQREWLSRGGPSKRPLERPDLDEDDWVPALLTLRKWSEHYRWARGAVWDRLPTIASEAAYLRAELHWIRLNDPDNWSTLCTEINQARTQLENIVHAGDRRERSRIVCNNPLCPSRAEPEEGEDPSKPARLFKVYGPRSLIGHICRTCHAETDKHDTTCPNDQCPDPDLDEVWSSNRADDRWKCPACRTRYDNDGLRRAHADQLMQIGARRYVRVGEAVATLVSQGRSERTVRKWLGARVHHVEDRCTVCRRVWEPQEHPACPGVMVVSGRPVECGGILEQVWTGDREAVVDSFCEVATHHSYVWWPDLWKLHNDTPRRQRRVG